MKVNCRKMSESNIGIDIGGTFLKGVLIENGQVIKKVTRETRDGDHLWQSGVSDIFDQLTSKADNNVVSIGLSAPGIADVQSRKILAMPGRLEGLEGFDWSDFLQRDVYVLNDAHAALISESAMGVAQDFANVAMFTLGTGVGGGLLIDGKLHRGFLQRAGHLGHISIDSSSEEQDITGISGSLEDAVGEATLSKRSLGRYRNTLELVSDYQKGDTWASYVWLSSLRKLALGIVSICNAVSPELIVLAGGITGAGEQLLQPLTTFLDLYEWRATGEATPIRIAKFKEFSGAIGAALYAKSNC